MPIAVFKVGGSLFTLPDLADRIREVLNLCPGSRVMLVAGGGSPADCVRVWSDVHKLSEEQAHWLALRAMGLNEVLLLELLPEASLAGCRSQAAEVWKRGRIAIACAHDIVRREEATCDRRLPHCWDVTSDSIAAWIALRWSAEELILLKSTSLPRGIDALEATRRKLVDPYFFHLASGLARVGWVNARGSEPRIDAWSL